MIHRDVPYRKKKVPGTLQGQAWNRAIENSKPKAGTPHDWEYYEQMIGVQNGTTSKEERPREPERKQYIESYNFVEWENTYFQESCVRYAEYSVQYHAPPENH